MLSLARTGWHAGRAEVARGRIPACEKVSSYNANATGHYRAHRRSEHTAVPGQEGSEIATSFVARLLRLSETLAVGKSAYLGEAALEKAGTLLLWVKGARKWDNSSKAVQHAVSPTAPLGAADTRPDLSTPARRAAPPTALGRAHPSWPRLLKQWQPQTRPTLTPSPRRWSSSSWSSPHRCRATDPTSSCNMSTWDTGLGLVRSACAMARAGSSRGRRDRSRHADLMRHSGVDGRMERIRRYVTDVTDVTVGHSARPHRVWTPAHPSWPWERSGSAYRGSKQPVCVK